ncbi:calcium-binding protein [Nocardioides stalactiti]|uniref:calcium-binding protein n=1 Tax=Nocardioides stalactiti TaxID=2755356 RepID=UPI00160241A6|nr:calcium-binding protein [Nocardioides stalactiti]
MAAGLLAAAGVAAMPSPAAYAVSGTLLYDAGGVLIHVNDNAGATVSVIDQGASFRVVGSKGMTLTSGAPCTQVSANVVDCPLAGMEFWELTGGSGPDTVFADATQVDGELFLGLGDDYYQVGHGKDFVHGGGGIDSVSYNARDFPVNLSLNGQDDDGEAGEEDYLFNDIETFHGGEGDDTFRGNGAAQKFFAGGGNDIFYGSLGASDFVQGQSGLDSIEYDVPASVSLDIDMGAQTAEVGAGAQVDTYSQIERAVGGAGNDLITGSVSADWIVGGGGADVLRGDNGNDLLFAEGNGSTMDGGLGSDTLIAYKGTGKQIIGGVDTDTVVYSGYVEFDFSTEDYATTPVTVDLDGAADDGYAGQKDKVATDVENIEGTSFADKLTGNTKANELRGLGGNDTLSGGGGNDLLAPQAVNPTGSDKDVVSGGGGKDRATYAGESANLVISLDNVANDGPAGDVDNVKSDVEEVQGGSGNDQISGSGGANTLLGGSGNDELRGNGGADVLNGQLGGDVLIGGAGSDTVSYADRLVGVTVTLNGTAGDGAPSEGDWVQADIENIEGTQFDDYLVGNNAVNKISALHGEDYLEGLGGNDTIDGGEASDVFGAAGFKDGADKFIGGSGQDTIDYGDRIAAVKVVLSTTNGGDGEAGENDTVKDDIENVTGGGGNDTITGSLYANILRGGEGSDVISGGDNHDFLYGEGGNDTLDGGSGSDLGDGGPGTGDVCSNVETPINCEAVN